MSARFHAANRFRIAPGREVEFEALWVGRVSHLKEVEGFISFNLLRGPRRDGHTLYASHSVWRDRSAFEGWTRSEAFRASHAHVGADRSLYLGPPELELFEVVEGA